MYVRLECYRKILATRNSTKVNKPKYPLFADSDWKVSCGHNINQHKKNYALYNTNGYTMSLISCTRQHTVQQIFIPKRPLWNAGIQAKVNHPDYNLVSRYDFNFLLPIGHCWTLDIEIKTYIFSQKKKRQQPLSLTYVKGPLKGLTFSSRITASLPWISTDDSHQVMSLSCATQILFKYVYNTIQPALVHITFMISKFMTFSIWRKRS